MKKILLLLALPFFVTAQGTLQKPGSTDKNASAAQAAPNYQGAKKKAYDLITGYRRRVLRGESMGTLAGLYSDDPGSSKNGGIYKDVSKGMMVPEFESAAFNLTKPGDISDVFETKYGFHFVQLVARHGDLIDLRHILVIPQ